MKPASRSTARPVPRSAVDRVGAAIARLILLLAPRRFRRDYGAAAVDDLVSRAGDLRRAGGWTSAARHWVRQWFDLTATVVGEWGERLGLIRSSTHQTPATLPDRESHFMDALFSDLRYSLRALIKQPGVSVVIILTLALGIGANTAIFSILDAVVLRPLPFAEPDELMLITDDLRTYSIDRAPLAPYEVRHLRDNTALFETIGASSGVFQQPLTSDDGDPEQIQVMNLTPGYLEMLGSAPLMGRAFVEEEGDPLAPEVFQDPEAVIPPTVAVLSHGFWQRRFGGAADVLGQVLTIGGRRAEVIGVLPEDFRMFVMPMLRGNAGNQQADVYMPVQADFDLPTGAGFLMVVGRLKDGVTVHQGSEEIAALSASLRESHERNQRSEIYTTAVPWGEDVARDVRPALLALLGAVGFVLLIACTNVANLLLARAAARRQEIAVRAALGARRGRIVRQVLTESLLLAGAGGALGLLIASWGVQAILALQPDGMPRAETVSISSGVLLFTVAATALAVVIFSAAPALALSGVRGNLAVNERGTGGGTRGRSRVRATMVVAEVALSLVLLVGAGLMLRSFGHLTSVDPGFRPERLLTFQIQLPAARYRDPEVRANFMREAADGLESLQGVEAVGVSTGLPLTGALFAGSFFTPEMSAEDPGIEATYRGVMSGYFEAMGTPLLQGRDFDPLETNDGLALVDEQLAEHTFPGESALGRTITLRMPSFPGGPPSELEVEIIGVVGNVRDDAGMAQPGRRTVYLQHRVISFGGGSFALRTSQDTGIVLPLVRRTIGELDPDLPLFSVREMQGYIDDSVAPVRFTLVLTALFGAFALVLAAIGLYGVLANAVRQETRDLGVRLAFGATSGEILRHVVGRGAALTGVGIVLGMMIAIPLTRALRSLFVGVEPTDPLTLVGVSLLLLIVSVLACYLPARRASRLDPAASLRAG